MIKVSLMFVAGAAAVSWLPFGVEGLEVMSENISWNGEARNSNGGYFSREAKLGARMVDVFVGSANL